MASQADSAIARCIDRLPGQWQQHGCPRGAGFPAPLVDRVLMSRLRGNVMRILLAIDECACSAAATAAVIEQFMPAHTVVHVTTADDWPDRIPPELALAEGPDAA